MEKIDNTIYSSLVPENKKWWAYLLMGCLFILIGLWIAITPASSFFSLSLFFSLALIVIGIFEMIISIKIIHESKKWGGFLTKGFFDVIIGALLLFNPFITINLLPYLIALWIMYRSIRIIFFAFGLKSQGIKKWYWNLAFGTGTFGFGLMIMIYPILGGLSIAYTVALAFLVLGFFNLSKAYQMNKIHLLKSKTHR